MDSEKAAFLLFLVGKEICQVAIGSFDVQFNWGSGGISVWNKFRYKPAGTVEQVVWSGQDPELATPTVRLLQQSIKSVESNVEGVLRLRFSNGDELEIFQGDEGYEAYSIHDGDAPMIIV